MKSMVAPALRFNSVRLRSSSILHWQGWLALISPALLLLGWYLVTAFNLVAEQILPSPYFVWLAAQELAESGELGHHLNISLSRLLIGFVVGAGTGLIFGAAIALFDWVKIYFGLLFESLRQIPTLVLIPMFILLFGVGETLKIVIIVKAVFFPVAQAATEGVKNIPKGFLEVAKIYHLKPVVLFKRVVLPATIPPVMTGIRIALGRAWLILVAVELLAADSGLGQMMEFGRQMLRLDIVLVGVIITGLIGFSLDKTLRLIESYFMRWRVN